MTKKRIVLCADDYGQALAISQGILNLLAAKRLSAVSCIVNTTLWPQHAQWLQPFHAQADIGLHFNLTEGNALSGHYRRQHGQQFLPLKRLLKQAFTSRLLRSAIEAECHAQIDHFQQETGFLPDYLDGHQHVHQFPIVREAIISVYEQRLRARQAYIRLVNAPLRGKDLIKKIIIFATGTLALKRLLNKHEIPYNQSFAGIYAFAKHREYAKLFKKFLQTSQDSGLIMCHPGLLAVDQVDAIAQARYSEYQYFISDTFVKDCEEMGVVVSRFLQNQA